MKPIDERFWNQVECGDGCWTWTGHLNPSGRGQFQIGTNRKSVMVRAHRMAWYLTRGDIPAGLVVCHKCDNHACVRPDHLFLGTQKDNCQDAMRKGRNVFAERHGRAKLSADDVRAIRSAHDAGATVRGLARQYGMAKRSVDCIVKRINWASVA